MKGDLKALRSKEKDLERNLGRIRGKISLARKKIGNKSNAKKELKAASARLFACRRLVITSLDEARVLRDVHKEASRKGTQWNLREIILRLYNFQERYDVADFLKDMDIPVKLFVKGKLKLVDAKTKPKPKTETETETESETESESES